MPPGKKGLATDTTIAWVRTDRQFNHVYVLPQSYAIPMGREITPLSYFRQERHESTFACASSDPSCVFPHLLVRLPRGEPYRCSLLQFQHAMRAFMDMSCFEM
eukprot:2073340-Amphidinium_carterae.1